MKNMIQKSYITMLLQDKLTPKMTQNIRWLGMAGGLGVGQKKKTEHIIKVNIGSCAANLASCNFPQFLSLTF